MIFFPIADISRTLRPFRTFFEIYIILDLSAQVGLFFWVVSKTKIQVNRCQSLNHTKSSEHNFNDRRRELSEDLLTRFRLNLAEFNFSIQMQLEHDCFKPS